MTGDKDYYVHPTAVIDTPVKIGKNSRIWHFSHIMSGVEMGEGCNLGQNVFIASDVKIGNNVKIQNNVSIYAGVTCEDDVFLGPSMVFTNVINPRSAVNRRGDYQETYLERGVTVGANATIVCGTRLGEYAFVGAGTVVTRDLPAYALVVGNPSRQIGWMSRAGHRLHFDESGIAVCPEAGDQYKLEFDSVTRIHD